MALFDFFRRKANSPKKIEVVSEVGALIYNTLFPDKSNDELYSGWVYAAIQAIAEQYAIIDLKLMKKSPKGDKVQIFDHPALTLLNYVNEGSTKYDLLFSTGAHLELNGKFYWFILPNTLGTPVEVVLPDPTRVKPIIDKYGALIEYRYYLPDTSAYSVIDKNLVVPFKNFNPKNNQEGLSTLSALKGTAEIDEFAKAYSKNWFKNSARPDIVLKFEQDLTKDQKEKLKAEWKQRYSGPGNVGKMLIAPKGMSVETLSQNHSDMEYIEQRKFNREEILGIFRVPKTILGLTEEVNRASAEAALYTFVAFTMMPKYRKAVATLNEFFLPMFPGSENLEFEFGNVPPEDPQVLMAELAQGISGGIYTVNEARRKKGLPEVAGGDSVYLPFGLAELGTVEKEKAKLSIEAKSIASELGSFLTKAEKLENSDPVEASENLEFEAKGSKREKEKDEFLAPYEKKFFKAANDLFADQKKRAVAEVSKLKSISEKTNIKWNVKAGDILNTGKEVKLTIDIFTPLFEELVRNAGKEALKYIGSEDDFDMVPMQDFIKNNTLKFAKELNSKTLSDLKNLVAIGVEQGESTLQIAARIQSYVGFSAARSETIARTETIRGASNADIEAWKQSDLVEAMIWYTALDERVDDACAELHGKEVGLSEQFMSNDELQDIGVQPYGGNNRQPPLHPNCRCLLIPKVKN